MGGSSKKGDGGSASDISAQLDPYLKQMAGQSNAVFGATSPLLGGIAGQYANMLGIPTGGAGGGLVPANPGTGIQGLSNPSLVTVKDVNRVSGGLDAGMTIPGREQLFDAGNAAALAQQFTATPDNVSQFGAAKELAEAQYARARDDALSTIGGTGGAGAINATIGNLASDRAMGLSQVFADLARNEALARERGFDRGIGIESGVSGNLADMQFRSDQANLDRSLALLQNRANTANQIKQANVDRAIGISTGGTNIGMQGIGNAGNLAAQSALSQAQIAQANADRDSAKKGSTGSALGQIISAGKAA